MPCFFSRQEGKPVWLPRPGHPGDCWSSPEKFEVNGFLGHSDQCGSPALGAMVCGLRGFIATGAPLLQIGVHSNTIGSGPWVWPWQVGGERLFCGQRSVTGSMWEPRPRVDGWSARLHRGGGAAPANKRSCKHHRAWSMGLALAGWMWTSFLRTVIRDGIDVGAPPSGRWFVVCEASSRRGRRSCK